jgi:uncharacterized pyridoxal phosphate-containing UPF0001 family protein
MIDAEIKENVRRIRSLMDEAAKNSGRRGSDISLVAASKTHPAEAVRAAVAAGVDAVGEKPVPGAYPKDAQGAYSGAPLHFIGHLQTNKLKNVVGAADLIQSVDSENLLRLISARAVDLGIVQDVLLEINIAGELSKSGLEPGDLPEILDIADTFPAEGARPYVHTSDQPKTR